MKNSFLVIIELGIDFTHNKKQCHNIKKVSTIVKATSFSEAFKSINTDPSSWEFATNRIPDYACIVDMRDLGIDREPA